MMLPARGSRVKTLERAVPARHRFATRAFFCVAVFFIAVFSVNISHAEFSTDDSLVARSFSGQFIVSAPGQSSPLFFRRDFAADTNFVRLEPALLAVAAERFRELLWRQLGLKPDSPWSGKIYLLLQPAHSPDDEVTIASDSMLHTWNYRVTLPDILTRTRYARALSAVLLLEIAGRDNPNGQPSAEIPSWLVDGLARQVLDEDAAGIILSTPSGSMDRPPLSSVNEKEHGLDSLATARQTLQNFPALTFDQLSWPSDEQVNGDDDGVYQASAQLFVHELSRLPEGSKKLRALLARLPGCQNWQTAFFFVYHGDFKDPVAVEKWWSLRTLDFAAHNSSSQWTMADSSDRLAGLLQVPVEMRSSSNSLPAHAQISLQTAIRDFAPGQRDAVLDVTLRDLELAQFRLAPPFAALAAGYRDTIMDFLGERPAPRALIVNKHDSATRRATVRDTLKKLDALDNRRRVLIARLNVRFVPRNVHAALR